MPQSRRSLFQTLAGAIPAVAMAQQSQAQSSTPPVVITPGPTTFGPPKPVNGECPVCHTKHKPLHREEAGILVGAYQQRCVFCSCLFVIDTGE